MYKNYNINQLVLSQPLQDSLRAHVTLACIVSSVFCNQKTLGEKFSLW